jgi:CCR4-NOT transcription complex subunit 6
LGFNLGISQEGSYFFLLISSIFIHIIITFSQAILDEIRHYSADIISLQEVETDQFYNFFKPELKNDGYEGIFSPKSRAKTMSENDRKYVDGCAIFFRANK